jgi:ferredoxin
MKIPVLIESISQGEGPLTHVDLQDQIPLPPPFDKIEEEPPIRPLTEAARAKFEVLDDTIAVGLPKPASKEEEERLVQQFLSGMRKLFRTEDNWTFLQPLVLSMEHCARCHTCSDACPIFQESGENPLYRPSYRSEVLRRIYFKYVKGASPFVRGNIELNWKTVSRLIELSYRCNLCRRCAQTCPIGVDNALWLVRFGSSSSQEMGIAAKELHDSGSMLQLKSGLLHRNECPGGQGQYRVHRRGHVGKDRDQGRDPVGCRRGRRPADP